MVFDLAHDYQPKKHLKHSSVSYIVYQPLATDTRAAGERKDDFKYIYFHACAFKLFAF